MRPQIEDIARLRVVVGYLGEQDQFSWWQSSFFAEQSGAFLAPVFGRTQLVAQYSGVVQAAALTHDDHIGIGRVFHLFRLPEAYEQSLRQTLARPEFELRLMDEIANREQALSFLRHMAIGIETGTMGPVLVGAEHDMRTEKAWQVVATHYLKGFDEGNQVFPYFQDSR